MSASTSASQSGTTRATRFGWGAMTFLAVAIAFSVVVPYLTFSPTEFGGPIERYQTESTSRVYALYVHIIGSGLALLIGPFQFLLIIRKRWPSLHRWLGRIYLGAGVGLGGISALFIAPGIQGGLVGAVGISLLAVLWLWTGLMAYRAIRAGRVVEHREWMIRNFALTFAAVTLRLWLGVLIALLSPIKEASFNGDFNLLFTEAYRVVMWLSWVPNLLVAEYLIVQRRAGLMLRPAPEPQAV
jgi:uncharacterized membrane protein